MVLYWYQSHGRVVASEYWGRIYTVTDAIRYNRTDAALVRVIVPILGDTPADVERRASARRSTSFRLCSRILAAIFRPERLPEVHVMSAWNVSKAVAVVLAVSLAAAGCRKDPEFAKQEYLKSGDRYMESGKVAEAIVQYRNAVQQDPRFGEARLKLAEAYIKKAM